MPAVVASVCVLTLIVAGALVFALRRQDRVSGEVAQSLDRVDRGIEQANKDRHTDFLAQKTALGNVARDTAARLARIEKDVVDLRRRSEGTPRVLTDADMTSPGTRAFEELVFDGSGPRVNLVLQN